MSLKVNLERLFKRWIVRIAQLHGCLAAILNEATAAELRNGPAREVSWARESPVTLAS
jgi:hypothetical protein